MTTKHEAKMKVHAAAETCAKVQASWVADRALGGSVTTNGYGIYSARFELRTKLEPRPGGQSNHHECSASGPF